MHGLRCLSAVANRDQQWNYAVSARTIFHAGTMGLIKIYTDDQKYITSIGMIYFWYNQKCITTWLLWITDIMEYLYTI